jgi:hypothetical protein
MADHLLRTDECMTMRGMLRWEEWGPSNDRAMFGCHRTAGTLNGVVIDDERLEDLVRRSGRLPLG